MKFPTVGEIATTKVVTVNREDTLSNVLDTMCHHGHRNVVVADKCAFYLLGINDILNIKMTEANLNTPVGALELARIPTIYKNENILSTVEFLSCNLEHICALNEDGTLYGILTHTDITSSIDPDTLMSSFCLDDF